MMKTVITSVLAAFGATLCCTGPLIALSVGSTSLGMFAFIEPIRPYFSLLALGMLGWGYVRLFRKSEDEACCDLDKENSMKHKKNQKRILLGITPLVIALLLFPYFGYDLFAEEGESKSKGEEVEVWNVEGMTCNGCALGLEKGLNAVEGIVSCQVNYNNKTMVCTFNQQTVTKDEIESFVKKMGYRAISGGKREVNGES